MQDFTNYTPNAQGPGSTTQAGIGSEALFFQRIYTWMFAGLGLTALTAFIFVSAGLDVIFRENFILFIGALVVELGLVWYLASRVHELEPGTAKAIFLGYAALSGATFSVILAYAVAAAPTAIIKAFVCTAGIYGAMAAYGMVTKRSLEGLGAFLYMGLIGLIIAMIVNIFVASSMFDLVICVVGVLVFAGLTAFDHQKLRVMYFTAEQEGIDEDSLSRIVIIGALELYLDFVNLFMFLLRIFLHSDD
jgi:Integral membrane protein, interacts with FtsH